MPRFILALGLIVALASCGGGRGSPSSPAAVTISDVSVYLAQVRCPDGAPPTQCANPVAQQAGDQMLWRRWDSQDQYEDSVQNGAFWETTWSYPPHGPFIAANGDGGEVYVSDGTTVSICCSQDGGKPGIQRFPLWGLFNNRVPNCSDGWGMIDALDRACRATITYPASGFGLTQIVADTIVSEHYSQPNQAGDLERFFLAAGWGRLCWEAAAAKPITPRSGMASSCGSGAPALPRTANDRRLITTLVAMSPPFASVSDYGWPPTGVIP